MRQQREPTTPARACRVVAMLLFALALTGCVVDTPAIESETTARQTTTQPAPTAAFSQVEPTAPPPPTAPPAPTSAPTPTSPPPEPTATSVPTGPTPLPTVDAANSDGPSPQPAGLVRIPVGSTSFVLDSSRPVLQLAGHTLIYIDDQGMAEVDIFTPVAQRDGTPLASYNDVIAYIETDQALAALEELDEVTIAGLDTRVFEGTITSEERGFFTDLETNEDDVAGWFPPLRVRMWVVDASPSPIIVTAESLEDPGQYTDAIRLASEILSTIDFG